MNGVAAGPVACATHRVAVRALPLPGVLLMFGSALFLSAALLFVLELMFAKMALPLLGGSSQVWNTCVVFFQTVLFAGYAYAHLTTRWLGLRRQAALHAVILLAALALLPVRVASGWVPPAESNPVPWLLALLATSVGLPFFVLASTAPLVQRWFAATDHARAADPYFLYVASNAGSLAGLMAYPFFMEPVLRVVEQSLAWTIGYTVFAVSVLACTVSLWASGRSSVDAAPAVLPAVRAGAVSWPRRLRWLALSLVPSMLMLATTTYLSTDVAAFPLLWVVPLAIYLVTFMLAFADGSLVPDWATTRALPVAALLLALSMIARMTGPLWLLVPLHLAVLFLASLACHRRLALDRPDSARLTDFYLFVAGGGAIGGLFNTLLAPLLFTDVLEYPIALVAACALSGAAARNSRSSREAVLVALLAGTCTCAVLTVVRVFAGPPLVVLSGLIFPALLALRVSRWPSAFAGAVLLMLLAGRVAGGDDGVIDARRTFFGVHRVSVDASREYHELFHGTTLHGRQAVAQAARREPLTYYARSGPIGQVFDVLPQLQGNARVAVVGLGAGTLAAYAREGQTWVFYEIDPAVEAIARDSRLFRFLEDSRVQPAIVLGDGRLSLARTHGAYDLIVIDAFSSDSIPVHLLTKEALRLYVSRLTANGVLAIHISNRHFALRPVVGRLAADQHLNALAQAGAASRREMQRGVLPSEWVVAARDRRCFGPLIDDKRWVPLGAEPDAPLWTDDFSNIFGVLKAY
jgi:hypothetical protein